MQTEDGQCAVHYQPENTGKKLSIGKPRYHGNAKGRRIILYTFIYNFFILTLVLLRPYIYKAPSIFQRE